MRLWLKVLLVVVLALGFIWLGSWWSEHHPVVDEASDYGCGQIVIVSKVDIAPHTDLDPLIAADDFGPRCAPDDARVEGAVTDLKELEHQTAMQQIFANEQIIMSRLDTG